VPRRNLVFTHLQRHPAQVSLLRPRAYFRGWALVVFHQLLAGLRPVAFAHRPGFSGCASRSRLTRLSSRRRRLRRRRGLASTLGFSMNETPFREVWVDGPNGQSVCALISGEVGWLMYLREPEDAGFSSRNPGYQGPPEAVTSYVLANGQRDEYPSAWTYPVAIVEEALSYFRAHGAPPSFITWHNDSGDGLLASQVPTRHPSGPASPAAEFNR